MLFKTRDVGIKGEQLAVKHLKKCGYKILSKNYKNKCGEIDIICKNKDTIIFVEVKTRTNKNYGDACEAVNLYKQKKIISVSKYYLLKNKNNLMIRYDVIEVYLEKDNLNLIEINHIENAYWE